ncbi:MBL fold metallo-hydrolase [Draconibacterium halophilum]|uniref:MBL fold metallo-hydrolase n=1 Tax=Draconibacterium halophilum TaxID=2706887 RepID=A0A6C0R997_9BACT|nr:MBL fold metallo-hydrolase [Draconibacterium halophilum]QIA07044.1 MBL fold metallo-hydrolase [Draconibacterium halophilum]
MLEICAIASGSNGNCYYIGNENSAILVDAGISTKQILRRMSERGLDADKLRAVFITHEHSDHMRGARVLGKRLQIPVYMSAKTYDGSYKNLRPDYPRFFTCDETIAVDEFTVHPVKKYHDAAEPYSFRISYKNLNIGVFTDIGEACENVKAHVGKCNALFLESNYDEKMLWAGRYPQFLKERVASKVGHLSNNQAFELLNEHTNGELRCVFLSHISKDNNTHEKALKTMQTLTEKFEINIASRFEASEVYQLSSNNGHKKQIPNKSQNLKLRFPEF